MAVEAIELGESLLEPLTLVKGTLDDMEAGDVCVAGLKTKVSEIDEVLKSFGSLSCGQRKRQQSVPREKQQSLIGMLNEAKSRLETVKRLRAKTHSKNPLKNWFRARHLKNSFLQARDELNGVIENLNELQTASGEDRLKRSFTNLEKMEKQWVELRDYNMECSIAELPADGEEGGKKLTSQRSFQDRAERMTAALQIKTSLRYNQRKLEFLQKQMEPLRDVDSFLPSQANMQDWQSSWVYLDNTLDIAATLIQRHECQFNLQTFYNTERCQKKVEMICGILKIFVDDWAGKVPALKGVHVEDTIPSEAVEEDTKDLNRKLNYILKGKPCDFPQGLKAEWQDVKARHEASLSLLDRTMKIIKKNGIKLQKRLSEDIWEAEYDDTKVTVKKVIDEDNNMNLENFAKFFNEVVIMGSLCVDYVAKLVGASKSGMLVVERGDRNLMQWYKEAPKPISWRLKLSVLLQAAMGLESVHEHEVIHRFVKSVNFLMFDTDSVSVKIADFSSATTISEVKSISTPQHCKLSPWIAPEIYNGDPHSLKSDVFSFGVILHEVAAERQPYGLSSTEADVYAKKKLNERPCQVPRGCPEGLAKLMLECCAPDPRERPSMPDVVWQLKKLQEQQS